MLFRFLWVEVGVVVVVGSDGFWSEEGSDLVEFGTHHWWPMC